MKGPLEKGELFAVLEYMKGGQVVTHTCAPPFKKSSPSSGPCPLPLSQAHHCQLPPLKLLLNQRWWPSLVLSQSTP